MRERIIGWWRAAGRGSTGKRDLHLDFLRGLAVSAMVVDHVGGDTILTHLSGGNRAIVSAAEAFVFLSGLVLGIVYGSRIRKSGSESCLWGLVKRAVTLYRTSIGVGLGFLAIYLFTDLRLWHDRSSGLGVDFPDQAAIGVLSLHYTFNGSDVLVMYTLMMAAAPAIFYMMLRGYTTHAVLASIGVWALFQRYPDQMGIPWVVQNSGFPVAAWQLLMVLGIVLGFYYSRVHKWLLARRLAPRATIVGSAVLLAVLAWSETAYGTMELPGDWFPGATYGSLFEKVSLAPGRALAFLCLAVVAFALVHWLWPILRLCLGWMMLPLGQHSLFAYVSHLFVLVAVYNVAEAILLRGAGAITADQLNLGAQVATLAIVWVLVHYEKVAVWVPSHDQGQDQTVQEAHAAAEAGAS